MAEFPALPVFTDAFIADTLHLNAAQTGAYFMLLMVAWRSKDCSIPDDDEQLARFARMDKRTWKQNKEAILSFWTRKNDGHLVQKRLLDERKHAEERRNQAVQAGRASALKRKERHSTDVATEPQPESNNPKPNPYPNKEKEKINKKEKVFPEKFLKFWDTYPRHRRGNRDKAYHAWRMAVDEGRATEDEILRGAKSYAASDPGEFAKGAAAWLNDDRWTWQTTDSAVKLEEAMQDWPPWKRDFAAVIGDKAMHSWFSGADFADGVLRVKSKFFEDKIRDAFLEKLQPFGLKNITVRHNGQNSFT